MDCPSSLQTVFARTLLWIACVTPAGFAAAQETGSQDGGLLIAPARESLPKGHYQVLSQGLHVPLVFGELWQTGPGQALDENPTAFSCDDRGVVADIPWSPGLRLALPVIGQDRTSLSKARRTFVPKLLPEQRMAVGDLITVRIKVDSKEDSNGKPNAISNDEPEDLDLSQIIAHACVVTDAGELWPIPIEQWGTEPGGYWLRFREAKRFTSPDTLAWFGLRRMTVEPDAVHVQFWSLADLRRSERKTLRTIKTGALTLTAKQGAGFGPLVAEQTLRNMHFSGHREFLPRKHGPLAGWLACPSPGLWKSQAEEAFHLTHIPEGPTELFAQLSGTTTVTHSINIKAGETQTRDVFEVPGFAGTKAPQPPFSERRFHGQEDMLWEAAHISRVWAPNGDLFSGGLLNALDQEGEWEKPRPWDIRCPDEGPYVWEMQHILDSGEVFQRWMPQGENIPRPMPFSMAAGVGGTNALRLRAPAKVSLRLADHPSTHWSGRVHVHLVGADHTRGQVTVHHNSFSLDWPEDVGRPLSVGKSIRDYTHWYATSPDGRGAFGALSVPIGSDKTDRFTISIDPSMDPGWSALVVQQQEPPAGGQPVTWKTLDENDLAQWQGTWTAAGGAQCVGTGFPLLAQHAGQFGLFLIEGGGVPSALEISVPGALQRTIRPPVDMPILVIQSR